MAIYMKYPDVDGESTTAGFEKQIELQSFQFGIGRGIASARGTSTRESSEASVSEITVTKLSDGASLKLMEESSTASWTTRWRSPSPAPRPVAACRPT